MTKAFEFKNVTKKFPGFQLGPLSFDLEPGTVLGFVGPNGSGKTTTMQCLTGLLKADSGEMSVFGHRNNPNRANWKLDIGYVGDVHVFYENWSAAKNLKFISGFYPNWSDKFSTDLARRFEVPLEKKAKNLSTGNRIKLSLIMALAHSPRLILLDEPTAGLDPVVRSEVLDVLFGILEDGEHAIFYSTHILSDISRLADELAFINNGRIMQRSAKDELTENWRRISFRLEGEAPSLEHVFSHKQEGKNHRIITARGDSVMDQLKNMAAQNILETKMTIDEIAVQILKENKNVANH